MGWKKVEECSDEKLKCDKVSQWCMASIIE
jgi:hypothetical protein